MKIKTAFFILSIFMISQSAFAAEKPFHKLTRGLEGIVTSPLEFINQYQIASEKRSLIPSLATGLFGGAAMVVKRLVNGVYDIVTFPVNLPKNYGLLLKDESETALDAYDSSQNYSSFPLGKKAI